MKTKLPLLLLYCVFAVSTFSQNIRSVESIGITDLIVVELAGNGDVWAGSANQGAAFFRADSAKWFYYDSLNSTLKSNAVTSIALSQIAGVPRSFIGTLNGGVITQSGPWDSIPNSAGLNIRGIVYRPDSLWVVTGPNIIRYDSSFAQVQSFPNPNPGITCVESGPAQCAGFWYGTMNKGCYFTSNGSNFSDSLNTSVAGGQLVNNQINALAIDNNCDRVFVGTKGGFSSCPTVGPPCLNYTTANGLPQNDITAVVVGCNNNVWLGTRDSGVVVYNTVSQQLSRVTTASNNVTAMACSQNCVAYVAAKDGSITQVDSNKTVIAVMTGVKPVQHDAFAVSVFPQPANHQINFAFEKEIAKGDLILTDVSGRTVLQITVSNTNKVSTGISDLPNGVYFYQLFGNRKLMKTGRVEVVK